MSRDLGIHTIHQPYKSSELPDPAILGIPLDQIVGVGGEDIIPLGGKEDDSDLKSLDFINRLYERTREGDFGVSLPDAVEYATHCMETIFPETDGKEPDKVIFQDHMAKIAAKSLRKAIEEVAQGKISIETAGLEAQMEMDRMESSFRGFLSFVFMVRDVSLFGNLKRAQEKYSGEQNAVLGRGSEYVFFGKVISKKDLDPSDYVLMQLVSVYHSFVLAQEFCTAARENRPVNADLVEELWKGNNIRRETLDVYYPPVSSDNKEKA